MTRPSANQAFEELLAVHIADARLPAPERQMRFIPGRQFVADFAWPAYRLIVEVQGGIWRKGGGAHSHPTNILRDIERQRLAVEHGWAIYPVTTDEVKNGEALIMLNALFQRFTAERAVLPPMPTHTTEMFEVPKAKPARKARRPAVPAAGNPF